MNLTITLTVKLYVYNVYKKEMHNKPVSVIELNITIGLSENLSFQVTVRQDILCSKIINIHTQIYTILKIFLILLDFYLL